MLRFKNMKNQLSERQRIEEIYHDAKCKHDAIPDTYERGETKCYRFFWDLIGDVSGLKVLDFGCGDGWVSILLAKAGARLWGIDLSGELIKKANKWAKDEGLSARICFNKMPGENLTFTDNFFDLILGSAILHHTDINLAITSIFRVLKPGGRAIFIEPLNQNIFLRIWRRVTPWRRSPTERALTNKDLEFIQGIFNRTKYNFFGFTSIFSEGLILLLPKNKSLVFINALLEKLDSMILRLFPSLGKYSAVVVLELRKENVNCTSVIKINGGTQ